MLETVFVGTLRKLQDNYFPLETFSLRKQFTKQPNFFHLTIVTVIIVIVGSAVPFSAAVSKFVIVFSKKASSEKLFLVIQKK